MITVSNPSDERVNITLGVIFKVYEIGGRPFDYKKLIGEKSFSWPSEFEWRFDKKIPLQGRLPNGKYAWYAYLKDVRGEIISRDEAIFNVTTAEGITGETREGIEEKVGKALISFVNELNLI